MTDLIPLAVVAVIVLVSAGLAERADKARKRVAETLSPEEIEAFRKRYWWPKRRGDMPTKFFEYAAAVDRFRRITFTACFIAFGAFAGWVIIGRATS